MKKLIYILLITGVSACHTLDLNPLSEPSTGGFYSNQTELELAVNDLYRLIFWGNDNELFSDNEWHRGQLTNAVIGGTMNADDATVQTFWLNSYKAIARANSFLANKDKAAANTPAPVILRLEAEMRLMRAYQYSRLITHFGDVPFLTAPVTLAESYGITRTNQDEILTFVFSELDFAAANLPVAYGAAETKRLTKGAALAVKARTALYMGKWQIARDAADVIIKSGAYALHESYSSLFLKAGETSKEMVISIPRDEKQQVFSTAGYVQDNMSRNAGGFGAQLPTRDMMDAYECVDGNQSTNHRCTIRKLHSKTVIHGSLPRSLSSIRSGLATTTRRIRTR